METVYLYLAFAWLVGLGSVLNLYEEGIANTRDYEDWIASLLIMILNPILLPIFLGTGGYKNE